ncbi:hypothetical protein [Pseudomonas oryzihabitans]|uniref:hypothetical protein n=1 Tax=Pseudomonas oryzihabitans TaxID=47885 RepID=UPI0028957A3D|nr:hypothetical protein [Pseudomonas oryzihabitans]MDT3720345.1 hypothetical protein [Pseudomonas oryzihabitans]
MARRIGYTGSSVLTLADVARQCRVEPEDLQPELIEGVIIPGVTAQAEARTGAAIRTAVYEEDWVNGYRQGQAFDVGQVREVVSVQRVLADGTLETVSQKPQLSYVGTESLPEWLGPAPAGRLRIRYSAGVDLAIYPGVRMWLLLSAGTAYEFRESLIAGVTLAEIPATFTDVLLADVTLPPRF